MERIKYDSNQVKERFNLITDDMLYNIILNLRNNDLSFEELAENIGITKDELLYYMTEKNKDFFVCLEGISYFEEKGIYKDYSRLKTNK